MATVPSFRNHVLGHNAAISSCSGDQVLHVEHSRLTSTVGILRKVNITGPKTGAAAPRASEGTQSRDVNETLSLDLGKLQFQNQVSEIGLYENCHVHHVASGTSSCCSV